MTLDLATEPSEDVPPAPRSAPRRRRAVLPLVLVGALVAAAVTVVAYRQRDAAPSGPAEGQRGVLAEVSPAEYDAAAPDVEAFLEQRASAVRDRDRSAFLRDLDRRDPAFLAEQRRLYSNLSQLDFAEWSYELSSARHGLPDLARTYAGPALIRVVVLRYALDGFDDRPVARPQGMTFVRRQGRWLLASTTDISARLEGGGGFTEPWETGAVVARRTDRALVITDADRAAELPAMSRAVETGIDRIGRTWPRRWSKTAVVVVVKDSRVYASYFEPGLPPDHADAVVVPLLTAAPMFEDAPEPVGLATSRMVLAPGSLDLATDPSLMAHELTHLATANVSWSAPKWLVEGFAEYVAFRGWNSSSLLTLYDLPSGRARRSVRLPAEDSFYGSSAGANYRTAHLACRYIALAYGRDRLVRLYASWDRSAGRRLDPEVRQDRALRTVLGVGTAELERDLGGWLRSL